jgi:hypothetical protein
MPRGGKRAGAGRTPLPDSEKKVPFRARIARDVSEYLATTENQTATVEAAVRGTGGFKKWKKGGGK